MKKILFTLVLLFSIVYAFGQERQLKVGVGLGTSTNGYVSVPLTFDIPINDEFGKTYLQVGAMISHNKNKVNTFLARTLCNWQLYNFKHIGIDIDDITNGIRKFNSWGFTPMVGWQFNNKFCVGAIVGANYVDVDIDLDFDDEYTEISCRGFGLEYGCYFSYTYKLINFQVGITNVKGGFINIGVKM